MSMSLRRLSGPTAAGGCRMCPVSCERVVYPAGCIDGGCPRAYFYEQHGRMVFGCIEKVFGVEIDIAAFRALEAQACGFGALRVVREPLPVCRSGLDRTFAHRAGEGCANPDFLGAAPGDRLDAPPRPAAPG